MVSIAILTSSSFFSIKTSLAARADTCSSFMVATISFALVASSLAVSTSAFRLDISLSFMAMAEGMSFLAVQSMVDSSVSFVINRDSIFLVLSMSSSSLEASSSLRRDTSMTSAAASSCFIVSSPCAFFSLDDSVDGSSPPTFGVGTTAAASPAGASSFVAPAGASSFVSLVVPPPRDEGNKISWTVPPTFSVHMHHCFAVSRKKNEGSAAAFGVCSASSFLVDSTAFISSGEKFSIGLLE
mmetsp:Transcript_13050/g.31763  ORF Transcript_13050/g.31763 Transcript_13050/m.31763 type:complete len:241 (-) Transcript_13050:21-743(-)